MRTIKKHGSLDNYLLNTSEAKLYDSEFGRRLKRRVTKVQQKSLEAHATVDQ